MHKIPVIAVVGPTGSGKTALGVALAEHYGGEVVSADSMQIYKGMSIATAKPTAEEMHGIPHHMIDFLPVSEKYSVARYVDEAGNAVRSIYSKGKLPVIVGGTGLYIDSLLDNIVFQDEPDNTEIRQMLLARRNNEGIEALYNELASIDLETAKSLHINNEGRVIRALEVYLLTGQKPSERRRLSRIQESDFCPLYIGLDYSDREKLYNRINLRVDIMLQNGLVKEAEEYYKLDNRCTASQAIGYKELAPYFNGEITLPAATLNLKQATRRYAKRQLTWFRKNERINWIYPDLPGNGGALLQQAVNIADNSKVFIWKQKNQEGS